MLSKKEKEIIPKSTLEKLVFKQHFSQTYSPNVISNLEINHGKDLVRNIYESYLATIKVRKIQIEQMKAEFDQVNKFFLWKNSKNPIKRILKWIYFQPKMRVDYESEFIPFWSEVLECSPAMTAFFLSKNS